MSKRNAIFSTQDSHDYIHAVGRKDTELADQEILDTEARVATQAVVFGARFCETTVCT